MLERRLIAAVLGRRSGVAALAIASVVMAACGSTVSVTGLSTPTPCSTLPPIQSDAFSESVQLTTTRSGLQWGDLSVGCGALVKQGSQVTIRYTVWLSNGKQLASSSDQGVGNFSFQVGGGQVIPGVDDGVLGMKVGGKRRLVLPPALAYGAQGQPPAIPPNATIVFDVEVTAVS